MRKRITVAFVLASVLALLSPLSPGGDAAAGVWISELMADPATDWNQDGIYDAQGDEWIEISNDGPNSVDLSALYVRDAYGDDAHLRLFGMLPAGAAKVFYGSDAVAWQLANDMSLTGFSLNNTGDSVQLFVGDPSTAFSELIDEVYFPDHTADDDRAVGPEFHGGALLLYDGLNTYSGTKTPVGTGCEPTPGLINECNPSVPGEDVSWGAVKTLYGR